ncbi:hypothetical protein KQ875_01650 [Mycoplasma zalophi]|uniref:Variable surface lipoprotein n=1 Tax=Mycoplasma zalophi TaxID=191287 RepID=A0ABS6DPP9_9MOLU|nr:hypothetical protein [Mycoplasma zalophi]MBU4692299.1 hypothetical protein [Mycoplasma zalophi]
MKKIKIFTLLTAISFSIIILPITAISCKQGQENTEKSTKIKQIKDDFAKIYKFNVFADELGIKEELNNLNETVKAINYDTDIENINKILSKINAVISNINDINKQQKHGLEIEKYVFNQANVVASEVVADLKKQTNWNDIKNIFKKYSVNYFESEIPNSWALSVEESSHAHDKTGIIHLRINIKDQDNLIATDSFTLIGFKKIEDVEDFDD